MPRTSCGASTWATSTGIRGPCGAPTSTIPTSCASTSTRRRACRGARSGRWRCAPVTSCASTGCSASRRPAARAGSTSTSAPRRAGPSPRCAAPRSRWPARSSAGCPGAPPPSGGRRSASACSWTTTRTPATARWPRSTRCARCPMPASRVPCAGTRWPTWTLRICAWTPCRRGCATSAIRRRRSTRCTTPSTPCSTSRAATRRAASATRRGRRTSPSRQASRDVWRPAARAARTDRLLIELVHRARLGRLVVAPALDLGAVADAPVGDVVEGDLDDELGANRDPFELTALRPAARLAAAALARLVRSEEVDELALLLGGEAAGVPDLAQASVLVVEPEDERAHGALGLARAPADHDCVDGAHALDLDHARALSGLVRRAGFLGDDPLGLAQPVLGLGRAVDDRRQLDRGVDERLERRAALEVGQPHEHLVVAGEQVEGVERRRCLLGQPR